VQADAWLALAGALEDATVSIVAPVGASGKWHTCVTLPNKYILCCLGSHQDVMAVASCCTHYECLGGCEYPRDILALFARLFVQVDLPMFILMLCLVFICCCPHISQVPGLSRTEVREAVMSLPEHLQDQLQALQASTSKGSTTQQPGVVELLGWDAAQAAFVPVVKAHARRLQQHSSFKQANNPAAKLESGPMEVAGSVLEPELLDSLPAKLAAVTAGEQGCRRYCVMSMMMLCVNVAPALLPLSCYLLCWYCNFWAVSAAPCMCAAAAEHLRNDFAAVLSHAGVDAAALVLRIDGVLIAS
jgi:hypothetical protein